MIRRLARSTDQIHDHYDVVIVGSGYGGGVAASRLARAGRSVCVLERGKELHPGEYPDTFREGLEHFQISLTPERHVGSPSALFDVRLGDDLSVLQGCGLGGTSLINANVGAVPDPSVFDDSWPTRLRGMTDPDLLEGFDLAVEMLKPKEYPGPEPDKLRGLRLAAEAMGPNVHFERSKIYVTFEDGVNHVGVEQHKCNDCGDCMSGCNYGAKNTVLMNYLPDAHNHGAEIFTEVRVHHLESDNGRWRVFYERLDGRIGLFNPPYLYVTADVVVLGAGSLGSTEILLRSSEHLPLSGRIGERFSGNGGVIALGVYADFPLHSMGLGSPDPGDPGRVPPGPCITGMIDLGPDPVGGERRVIEEGAAPGALADIPRFLARLAPRVPGTEQPDAMQRTQVYLSTSQDGSGGRLVLDNDHVSVIWKGVGETDAVKRTEARLQEAADAIGATLVSNPSWMFAHRMVTVHPLGGCVMGDDAEQGVVDDRGRVFAGNTGTDVHPGLYVADGSALSGALAYNPSLTITALAERMCKLLAQERGWHYSTALPSGVPARPSEAFIPTLEFSERMSGFISTVVLDDYQRAAEQGRLADSTFEAKLTVVGVDVERVLADPVHECSLRGWVRAPALGEGQLEVLDGTMRTFVPEPDHAETRTMQYRFRVAAPDGRVFVVDGHKNLHDDPGWDLWSDTTTLYVAISPEQAPVSVFAAGVLRMSAPDFLREVASLTIRDVPDAHQRRKYMARFGIMFFGSLYRMYGKVFVTSGPQSPGTVKPQRALRLPAPDVHSIAALDGTELRLTRYHGGGKGPVVVAHAFGTSTRAFVTPTVGTSFCEFLYETGRDVWLFDYRASTALPSSREHFTFDDIARKDWPAAIAHVRGVTGAADVQVVAHCVGSLTFLMAMLWGLQGVRSATSSALTTHPVPNPLNKLKVWTGLDRILPALGLVNFDTSFRNRVADRVFDTLLHVYPGIPFEEECTRPVCRRVTAIYGPSYKHAQLNDATHDAIVDLFGVEHVSSFSHVARILRAGKVIDAHGRDVYRPNVERLAIPIQFLHGVDNLEFYPETSVRAYEWVRAANPATPYRLDFIDDYGHMDVFIGKNAATDVYPTILEHLEAT